MWGEPKHLYTLAGLSFLASEFNQDSQTVDISQQFFCFDNNQA